MKEFRVRIDTENDEFQGGDGNLIEGISRLLSSIPVRLGEGQDTGSLYDLSGNRVGEYYFVEE